MISFVPCNEPISGHYTAGRIGARFESMSFVANILMSRFKILKNINQKTSSKKL